MDIVLWIAQILLALAFLAVGYTHGFNSEKARSQQGMQWMGAVPKGLLTFIGIAEILGGIGLIAPAATGLLPWLTPLAAAALALVMLLAMGFHAMRREYPNLVFNLVLFGVAAFVAYGRWLIAPL
ncbi:MAG: DoxX family protein [Anaerolineales bacterium]